MDKIVFVTGATSGIGSATAEVFARNGYQLILCGRREDILNNFAAALREKYKARVLAFPLDVSCREAVQDAVSKLQQPWDQIDILINNAGLAAGFDPLHEGDIKDWEQMIDTNIKGLLYVSRAVMPGMVARKSGHIVNLGSIAGKETYMNGNVYCATKYAVDALTKGMRMELLKYGIRVSQISPGAVETEFARVRFGGDVQRASDVYKGYKPLAGEDVAEAIYFMCTRPAHVCINDLVIMPTAQANTVHWHKE